MNKQQPRKPAAAAHVPQASMPVRLGAQHGYSFQGESVTLNAELQLPAYLSRGEYTLELWACSGPCEPTDDAQSSRLADPAAQRGAARVASLAIQLPTPLSALVHRVEGSAAAKLPAANTSHAMVVALVQDVAGRRVVMDVANYALRDAFPAPQFEGEVSYEIDGNEIVLHADRVANLREEGNQSGTLALELWAFAANSDASASGVQLANFEIAPISGGYYVSPVAGRTSFKAPAPGEYRTALLLREWTEAAGYVTRDERSARLYSLSAPAAAKPVESTAQPAQAKAVAPSPATAVAASPAASKPAVAPTASATPAVAPTASATPAVAPTASATPVAPAKPEAKAIVEPKAKPVTLVSLQTASLEELSKLVGLNARIAKELVKARPLTSWNDVLKVRGVGEATVQKLKTVATL